MKLRRVLTATTLICASILGVRPADLARADFSNPFPACTSDAQESCVELLEFTAPGGTPQVISDPTDTTQSSHPYIRIFDQGSMPGMLPMLGYSILDNRSGSTGSGTNDGLPQGTYRIVVRIGDFDPTVFISSGVVDSYTVTKGADSNWTIDATMTPHAFAGPSFDKSMTCNGQPTGWPTECETAGSATRRDIHGGVVSMTLGPIAATARGMWIATNAVGFQFPTISATTRSISAGVVGPHFLPSDYSTDCAADGLASAYGKCLTPAHYSAYVPFTVIASFLGVTVDMVKAFITSDAMTAEAYSSTYSDFSIAVGDAGIAVDMNIDHFSRPNPKIKFKALKTVKAGKSASRSSLISVPKGATVTEFKIVKTSSAGLCTKNTSGTLVTAAARKTGTCVLTWKYKKSGSRTVVSKKTAIRVVR